MFLAILKWVISSFFHCTTSWPFYLKTGHHPGGASTAPDDKDLSESSLFLIPEEEDHLEQNMPWLRVVTKFINSFNFFCTHQGFCHPNCYRRQMRAGKRIMEATRKVSEIKFPNILNLYQAFHAPAQFNIL